MMRDALLLDVEEICRQFEQQGMEIHTTGLDEAASIIDMELVFTDVECLECVMPRDYLQRLIETSLENRLEQSFQVHLRDPRLAEEEAATSTGLLVGATIDVLDPTGKGPGGSPDPGPDAGALSGKVVGFRVDALWRSWDWVVDEWTQPLAQHGVEVKTWRRWQGAPGDEGVAVQSDYEEFVNSSDVVISGLANCGSCSAWTIRDALTALNAGVATLAIATDHFGPLAKLLAEDGRRPGLRILQLPYPLDTLPEPEVRAIARNSFEGALVSLGAVL